MNDNKKLINVAFRDGTVKTYAAGTTILEIAGEHQYKHTSTIMAGKVNNDIKDLNYKLNEDCKLDFIDLSQSDGMRIYQRSLYFILIKAVNDIFPDRKVVINHPISKGVYCEVIGKESLTAEDVSKIKARMDQIVAARLIFTKKTMSIEEAKEIFIKSGRMDRYNAIEFRTRPHVTVYNCGGLEDYFYGYMAPDTGYVNLFDIMYYPPGLIVRYPDKTHPQQLPEYREEKKLFTIFNEFKKWNRILGIENVGALNNIVSQGKVGEIIKISEALHEKKIANIADMINDSEHMKKIILISGPSSSGKTTFAQRLAIQLRVNGIKPVTISLDDYFVDRDRTPIDEHGEVDFEALEAIDIELFNLQLNELINLREVEIPLYNFAKGAREPVGRKLKIDEDQVIIIEGIHGLNERLTAGIPRENKFKIYISALTSMNIDDHNRIPTTDTRIIRRIVRDYKYRGCSALNTIKMWPSVRRGEKKNIFPFQEEADVMFNSALSYELGVLKPFAEPILSEIDNSVAEYSEARRLIEFLSNFLPIDPKEIPLNSIIREFIGGSSFK